ncbi:hypothetical protein BD414DRAFT_495606 [Trametes punicea]|nr:hypothetical protein BD414DRAFT_495606 [Trametes punicea]
MCDQSCVQFEQSPPPSRALHTRKSALKLWYKLLHSFGLLRPLPSTNVASPRPLASVAPIDMLPNELLMEILEHVYWFIFDPATRSCRLREWIHLLQVCRRWRDIIYSVSRFWRKVPLGRDARLAQYLLSMLSTRFLDIYIDGGSVRRTLPLLRPYLSRIQLLHISMPHLDDLSFLMNALLPDQMIGLRELHVYLSCVGSEHRALQLPSHRVPFLDSLKLQGFALRPTDVCPHVRSLELSHCYWELPSGNFSDILTHWDWVWDVHLDCSLGTFPDLGLQWTTNPSSTISVLWLRTITVVEQCPDNISILLSSIDVPFVKTVDILYRVPNPAPADDSHYAVRSFVPSGAAKRLSLAFCDRCIASITIRNNEYAVGVRSRGASITFRIATTFDRDWSRALPYALEDLLAVFPDANVSTLVVHGDPYHVPSALWERLFVHHCRYLQTLSLTGNGTWVAMWRALCITRMPPEGKKPSLFTPSLMRLRLKKVHIQHVLRSEDNYPASPDEHDLETLCVTLGQLRGRKKKLKELRWAVQRSKHADYEEARMRFLARLKRFVDRLAYEDLG